jgi:hypothetical protein
MSVAVQAILKIFGFFIGIIVIANGIRIALMPP